MKIPNFKKNSRALEISKWIFVILLLVVVFIGNFFFYKNNFLVKLFLTTIILSAIGLIGVTTSKGRAIVSLMLESYHEIKKVIWPTRREILYNTIVIIMVTVITSVAIWGLDSILIRIISMCTSVRLF